MPHSPMKTKNPIPLLIPAFALFLSALATDGFAQTTVTYTQQKNQYDYNTRTGTAGDSYDGSSQLGMYWNGDTTSQGAVSWKTFRIGSATSNTARNLQIGDEFTITVNTRGVFYGSLGASLNSGTTPSSGGFGNRLDNSRIAIIQNGGNFGSGGGRGSWYAAGATSPNFGTAPNSVARDYTLTFKITSQSTANVRVVGASSFMDNTQYDVGLNGTAGVNISNYSIWLSDDRSLAYNDSSGGRGDSIWKQTTSVADTGTVELGYAAGSGVTRNPGVVADGLAANSTSTARANRVLIGGDAGSLVVFDEANTYTGNTTINSNARLDIRHQDALDNTSAVIVSSGGALSLNASLSTNLPAITLNLTGTGVSGSNGAFRNIANDNTWSGAINLGGNTRIDSDAGTLTLSGAFGGGSNVLYVGGSGNTTISGVLSGAGASQDSTTTSIFKDGAGRLTLTADNTYSGDTRISAGNLTVSGSGDLGDGSSDVFIASGATLNVNSSATVDSVQEYGSNNVGTISIGSGATLTVDGANKGTLQCGAITGSGNLAVAGSGNTTLRMYGTNTYSGSTTITGGTLSVVGSFANTTNFTVGTGATLDVSGTSGGLTLGTSQKLIATANGGQSTGNITVASSKNLTLGSTAGILFSGLGSSNTTAPLTVGGASAGALALNSAPVEINTSAALPSGTYTLIAKTGSATGVSGSNGTVTFSGSGVASGASTAVYVDADNTLKLRVTSPPSTQATAFGNSSVAQTTATISWTRGTTPGNGVLVVARSGGAVNADPSQATDYTANAAFGSGDQIVTGNWVVYKGTGTSVNLTGLTASTTYHFAVYEYNTHRTGNVYNLTELTGSLTTTAAASPTLTAATLGSALSSTYGTASSGVSFTAAGSALTGNITVTAQTGYEVSTSSGSGYGSSVSVASGTTVWVRFASTRAAGTYNSATAAVLSGGGASSNANVTTSSGSNTMSAKALSITTPTIAAKTYDGSTAAGTLTIGTLSGFVGNETVTATGSAAAFSSANAGTYSTTVSYTLADGTNGGLASNYSLASNSSISGTINKATPTVSSAPTASAIYYAQPLSSSTLSGGSASVAGSFAWTTSATVASPGTNSYSVTFTPTDTTNYNTATTTSSVTSTMAQGRNAAGAGSPVQPSTIYLGDNFTFQFDTWGTLNGAWGNATLYLRQGNADVSGGSNGGNTGFVDTNTKSITSSRFNASGTWYWGVNVDYGATYGSNFWLKASNSGWTDLSTTGTGSTLSFTVTALNNPSSQTATAASATSVNLAWADATSGSLKFTSIFRSTSATPPALVQGTSYATSTDHSIGGQTYRCIFNGNGATLTDSGLTSGQTYYYYFFAENYSHYSSGVSANVTLSSDYNLDVSTGNTQTQSVVSGGAATLTGTRALNKNGGGTLTLDSSSNSYTGVTTINNGTLSITVAAPSGSNGALGNAASAVVVGSGSNSTTFNIGAAVTNSRNLSISSGGTRGLSTTISSGTATQAGSVTSSADFNLTVPSGGTLNVTGNIDAGTSVIDKLDSGTAIIAGTMTNTATRFDVMAGELQFGSLASIGDRTGGFLQNKLFFGGGTLGITGNITLGGDNGLYVGGATSIIRVAADRTFEVQGYIQDGNSTATLAKTGSGTLFLNKSGAHDYSHTTLAIREGTLSTWNTGLLSANVTLGDTSTAGTYNFTKADGASSTTANFTISAGGGGFSITNDALTVSGIVSGSGNLTKTGAGDLSLTGTNTYTGNITITSGTLRINADAALGTAPGSARANSIILGAGTLSLDGAMTLNSTRGITLNNTGATIDSYGNNDTYNGIIASSGTTSLIKVGGGTLTLGGVNTYTGTTTISAGNLSITNASALGATGTNNGTIVSSGLSLHLSNGISVGNEPLTLSGTGFSDAGALRNLSGTNSWSGDVTIAANARINSEADILTLSGAIGAAANTIYVGGSGNTTISGAITGTKTDGDGAIFKDGTGTLTLSATNSSLSGLILIRAGTLAAATNANLTSGTIQLGNGNTTATLSLTGGDTTRSQNITVIDSSTAGVINISSGTLTLTGTLGQTGTVNTTKIGKSGGGTLRLDAANTYAGQIQIGEGTVILANNTAHGVNTTTEARAIDLGLNVGDTSMGNNVALYLVNGITSNASIYIAPNTSGATRTVGLSGSGSATFLNDHFLGGDATLTGGSGTITFAGAFTNTGGLIATGGTVVLNKANTFTGATVVNGGTLRLDVANALQSTASVTVNSGGNLTINATGSVNDSAPVTLAGGTLRLSGTVTEALGNLTVTASSVIDMGSGSASLTFASLASIGAGNEIAIHNYTEGTDALIFTDATTAGANTTRFKIYSDAGSTLIADAYFDGTSLKPVPAPSAPTLGSASMPSNTTNITLNWTDLTGATAETSYEIQYSSASTFTSPTAVTGIAANSTNRTVDVLSTGTRYFRLRGVNSRGNGTWSTTQVIQLNSLAAGSTTYLSAAGTPGANTVAGIFGSNNTAGLNDGTLDSNSTNILLLNDSGSTAHTIFYNSSANQWRAGATDMSSTAIPQGTAFMLRNRSGSTDYFLLAAAPRTANFTVSVNATAGQVNLLTPARSTATALTALNLRPTGGNATNSIQTNSSPRSADLILLPQSNGGFVRYYHDGSNWRRGTEILTDASSVTVPAGGAFFIRKGPGSQFNTYQAPAE